MSELELKQLEKERWGTTPFCPFCSSSNVFRFRKNERILKCKESNCRKKFTATVGTIYENSKIPLWKWTKAREYVNSGINSIELSKAISVTQKTAYYIKQKLIEESNQLDKDNLMIRAFKNEIERLNSIIQLAKSEIYVYEKLKKFNP